MCRCSQPPNITFDGSDPALFTPIRGGMSSTNSDIIGSTRAIVAPANPDRRVLTIVRRKIASVCSLGSLSTKAAAILAQPRSS